MCRRALVLVHTVLAKYGNNTIPELTKNITTIGRLCMLLGRTRTHTDNEKCAGGISTYVKASLALNRKKKTMKIHTICSTATRIPISIIDIEPPLCIILVYIDEDSSYFIHIYIYKYRYICSETIMVNH